MGATQSIPVIGEVVTIVDSAGRAAAAGALAITGQSDAAGKMIDSAGQSWVSYSERSAITGTIRRIATDDPAENERLKKIQEDSWTELGENTPVVGHIVGVVHYAQGDTEGGNRCMVSASRTTAVIGATAVTGGGALVVGGVALGAVAAYDAVATSAQSVSAGEYTPVGSIAIMAAATPQPSVIASSEKN